MVEINPKDVFDVLLESLKIQAEKYKAIISQDALTHEQRKDYDSEIKQMYELLSSMTNSSTVYTLSEIQTLKVQYELKIQELQITLDNIDVTTVKGDNGKSAYEVAVENGYAGTVVEWLSSLNGADGKSLTYDDLTQEQKLSLTGADGKSLTYDDLTQQQKQEIANLVAVDLSSIMTQLQSLQNQINALGGSVAPTVNTGNVVLNDLITSFVPTLANSKYYYDTQIVVPEQLEYFVQYYKTDFSLTDIANTYKITYLVTYNDKVYTLVYNVYYNEMDVMWDMTLQQDLSSNLSADSLNFNVELLNDNKFIFSCGFDSEAPVYISSFDFAVFIESDSAVPDLNITSIKNADDLDFYDWVSL